MGFDISSIIGGSLADAVAKIIGLFHVDPNLALQKQTELQEIQLQLTAKLVDQVSAQIEVNKVEAASTKWFEACWRPAIGWVCAAGLASQFLVRPFATWIATLLSHPIEFPSLDMGTLMTLLFGMLGMAGWRSYDKQNGVDSVHAVE